MSNLSPLCHSHTYPLSPPPANDISLFSETESDEPNSKVFRFCS